MQFRKKTAKTLSASTFTIALTQHSTIRCECLFGCSRAHVAINSSQMNTIGANAMVHTSRSKVLPLLLLLFLLFAHSKHSVSHCHCRWLCVSTIFLDTCWNRYLFHQKSFFIFIFFSFGFLFILLFLSSFNSQNNLSVFGFVLPFQRRIEDNRNKLQTKDNERNREWEKNVLTRGKLEQKSKRRMQTPIHI